MKIAVSIRTLRWARLTRGTQEQTAALGRLLAIERFLTPGVA